MTAAPYAPATGHGRDLIGLSQRLPPQNLQAEQALLGALLANNKAYDRVGEFLRPEHFADPAHAAVYAAIARRVESGQLADVVTLRGEFENAGTLQEVGGAAYLVQLLSAMVGIINAGEYGRLIRDAWARRQVIDACEVAVGRAFGMGGEDEAGAIVADLDERLSTVAQGQDVAAIVDGATVANRAFDDFLRAVDRRGAVAGVPTGYATLDRRLGGMRRGQLLVLAGRPGMGKTAMLAGIAARAAAGGARVLFVSAEMVPEDVMARALAAVSGLPLGAVRDGARIPPGTNRWEPFERHSPEVAQVANAARRLASLPIHWDGSDAPQLAAVRARARRLARRRGGGVDLVVVDYLGRTRGSDHSRDAGRYAEVSELARGYKTLARELGIPVLLGSQMSRASEKRDDRRPMLSDLRDSGEIEQEADVVMFLHREHYYLERARPAKKEREGAEDFEARVNAWYARLAQTRTEADLDVAKQRQGPSGIVKLRFDPQLTWFFDADDPDGAAVPGLPD